MKVFITYNDEAKTGYGLEFLEDNGKVVRIPIDRTYPGEKTTLVLPENPVNRKYFSANKVDNSKDNRIELTYKETKVLGPRPEGHTVNRKPIEDYMTDEERTTYLEILEKARQRKEEANKKPKMTELEKAERALEAAKRKLEALKAKQE